MFIRNDIKYIGVYDKNIDLFEGMYKVPEGITYNSYLIEDEKIAVMDSVDNAFIDEWLLNIENEIGPKQPDYLVVHHMEPDHSAGIFAFVNKYPNAKIVASSKAFAMMKNYFGEAFEEKQIVVGEGDKLELGRHSLTFITAPMVHWPEVILSYDSTEKILFSADAFGKFGSAEENENWADEARRYYIGIVGKYGAQVQALLKKANTLPIETICSLHGPVLTENIEYYVNLYNIWSSYKSEINGVLIAYTSVYGNTKKAVLYLAELLEKAGIDVAVRDLARFDMSAVVADAFKYNKVVFATTTYNADIFPFMREFINNLTERNFSGKTVAFIENGSWAPMATKVMKGMLEKAKNICYTENTVKILSALNADSKAELEALADELSK